MGEAQSAIEVFPTPSPPGLRPHEKIIEAAYVKDKMGERMKQDDIKSGSLEHAEHLLGMLRGYRQAQVLMTCTESGVFEALAGHGRSAAVLAAALALDPDALRRLLDAAVALGLLERAEDIYSNAPATAVCLASDGDNYLGHLFRRESAFYERWGRLPEAIRTGHRPEPNRAMEDTGDWVRNFEYALYDLARLYGPAVAEALDLASDRPWRVLDVGGGHGGYSIALARRSPLLTAVVFDLPPVIDVTQEIVAATEVADRVRLRAGDFLVDDLGRDYDAALLFGVLVSESTDRRLALLRRVHAALKPGGLLVLREFAPENDGTAPAEALLFDLQMLLSTGAGGVLKRTTLTAELEATGFSTLEIRPLPLPTSRPLWLARRG